MRIRGIVFGEGNNVKLLIRYYEVEYIVRNLFVTDTWWVRVVGGFFHGVDVVLETNALQVIVDKVDVVGVIFEGNTVMCVASVTSTLTLAVRRWFSGMLKASGEMTWRFTA